MGIGVGNYDEDWSGAPVSGSQADDLPKPSEVKPPQYQYNRVTEERLFTQTEVNIEIHRIEKDYKEQIGYLNGTIKALQRRVAELGG